MPTPYLIGTATAPTASSVSISVGTATTTGDTIVVGASASATSTVTGITDSQSNTYASENSNTTENPTSIWVAQGATKALTTAMTITVTWTSTGTKCAGAIGCTGLLTGPDQNPTAATSGGSTAPSITTNPLSYPDETAVALCVYGNGGGSSLTWASGWTALFAPLIAGSGGQYSGMAYATTTTSAALTASGTITSAKWCMMLLTFADAVTVSIAGQSAYAVPIGFIVPAPPALPLATEVSNIAGDWMFTVVSWRQNSAQWSFSVLGTPTTTSYFTVTYAQSANISVGNTFTDTLNPGVLFTVAALAAPTPTDVNVSFYPSATTVMASGDTVTQSGTNITVADDVHNWWIPLGAPTTSSSSAGVTRTAVWAAPAARAAAFVCVAPTAFMVSMAVTVLNVSGISAYAAMELQTTGHAAATSLSMSLTAPAAASLVITAAGSDVLADTISLASGGWSPLITESTDNGANNTSDIQCSLAWQVTAGATTAAWSSTGSLDFSGVMVAVAVAGTAPVQPNPNWPWTTTEIVLNAGPATPVDIVTWVAVTESGRNRALAVQFSQGRQYMLDQLQAGSGSLTLDDPDLALIPPGTGSFAGIDSGTPFRVRQMWPGGTWQVKFTGNGTEGSPQIESSLSQVAVAAGSSYSASAWVAESSARPGTLVGAFLDYTAMGVANFAAALTQWTSYGLPSPPAARYYLALSTFTYDTNMQQMVAAGIKICLTLRPAYNPVSATDLANMTTLLQTLQTAGANADVCLWHEPYYEGLTITQYQNMISYYGPTVREYYPLVFVTSVQSVQNNSENSYYPGDSAVDKCATDFFAYDYTVDNYTLTLASTPANTANPPKPFGIWELGVSTDPAVGITQTQSQTFLTYVTDYFVLRVAGGLPNCDILWFNSAESNLVSDPGFESGVGSWTGVNCTFTTSSAQAHTGSDSASLAASGSGNAGIQLPGGTSGIPVTASATYTAAGWFRTAATARSCQAGVDWYTSGGTFISSSFPGAVTDSSSAWTQDISTVTSPSNAAYAQLVLQVESPAASEVHYADDAIFAVQSADATVMGFNFGSAVTTDWRIPQWTSVFDTLNGSSQDSASGVYVGIAWRNSSHTLISVTKSALSQNVTATLVTATGTAPATTAYADIIIGAAGFTPPSSVTFYAAAAEPAGSSWITAPAAVSWQAANGATATTLASWVRDRRGAPNLTPWYIPAAGYFQRWPPSWNTSTYRGEMHATVADIWAYCNRELNSCLRQEILYDTPWGYWPLSDPATAADGTATVAASNIAPGNTLPLTVVSGKGGVQAATQAFGANSGGLIGDQVTTITTSQRSTTSPGMWEQDGVTPTTQGYGYTLQLQGAPFPSITNGVTISGFFQCLMTSINGNAVVWQVANSRGTILEIYIDPSGGGLNCLYWSTPGVGGGTHFSIENSSFLSGGTFGFFHLAVSFNQTEYTIYLFGGYVTITGTFASALPAEFTNFTVNGALEVTNYGAFYNGYSAHVAIHPYMVPQVRALSWYYAGQFAFSNLGAGEYDFDRVSRLLGYAQVIAPLFSTGNIGDGTFVVSCQDIGGQPAATSLTNIESSTVPSQLYVAPNNDIVYKQKQNVYNTPVTWVLGDMPAYGEIPFQGDYAPDYDPARVVNDIQLTQLDDESVTVPSNAALELASTVQYGTQTYEVTCYVARDQTLSYYLTGGPSTVDLANWIAQTNSHPYLRVAQVTVNAASHPAGWQFVSGAAVGDVVTVNIRPVTAGGQLISITGRITQTQRSLQFGITTTGTLSCVLDLAPDIAALTCDSETLGQLNGKNVLAWLPVGNVALPVPVTWTQNEVIEAWELRANVSDAVAFITYKPTLYAAQQSPASLANGTGAVSLPDELFDNWSGHSPTTDPSEYFCQQAGWYLCRASYPVEWFSATATGFAAGFNGFSGGVSFPAVFGPETLIGSQHVQAVQSCDLLYMSVTGAVGGTGDLIQFVSSNSSGSSVNLANTTTSYAYGSIRLVAAGTGSSSLVVPANPAWPTPPSWITSSFMNTNIRDTINFLLYPPIAKIYYTAGSVSIPNQAFPAGTLAQLNTTAVDNYSGWSNSTFLYTAPVTGNYLIYGQVNFSGGSTAPTAAGIAINAGTIAWGATSQGTGASVGRRVRLTAGNTVGLYVQQNSGSSRALNTSASNQTRLIVVWEGS